MIIGGSPKRNCRALFDQGRSIWGVPGAGEKVGQSIEGAAANAIDKTHEKLLPENTKMLTGETGLTPQLIQGIQAIADKSLEDVGKKLVRLCAPQQYIKSIIYIKIYKNITIIKSLK